VVCSLRGTSAPGRLWNCADCDLCRGSAYGISPGNAICHASHKVNSNLDTCTDSDFNTDADGYFRGYANANGHTDTYVLIYANPNSETYLNYHKGTDKGTHANPQTCGNAEACKNHLPG
jgi:hypothetical protein